MKQLKNFIILALALAAGACTSSGQEIPTREYYANEEPFILLQQPRTRVLLRCYANIYQPADICARVYEQRGFVRVRDIPHKPAKYDFLKKDTYPTRRWREGETTPRW